MILTEMQAHIPILSRQDKYRLIEFIIRNLSQEESISPDIYNTHSPALSDETQYKAQAIDSFLNKWRGFLCNIDTNREKYLYLKDKYQ